MNKRPDPEILRLLLRYDADTGFLFWKERPPEFFKSSRDWRAWNTLYSGKRALNVKNPSGYLSGGVLGVSYNTHRIIWALVTGEWPDQIDHDNRIRDDNRWDNLRNVDAAEQSKNHKMSKNNTSGHTGVYYHKATRKWMARIGQKYLGIFDDIDDAATAYRNEAKALGYHPNHGRSQE
jgi:hypothetical protein